MRNFASILCLSTLTTLAFAAKPGTYLGAGIGASSLMTTDDYPFDYTAGTQGEASRQRGGLGGRVFGGYNFNKYVGLEAGLAAYTPSKYSATVDASNSSLKYSLNAFDVVGKAYLPISDSGFNLYALAGGALVNSKTKFSDGGVPAASGFSLPAAGSHSTTKVRPVYGLGASYDFSAVTTNLEFSHIQGLGDTDTNGNAIPSANLLTLNLAYNFS